MGHKQTLEQASGDVRFTYESGHAPSRPEMSAKCQQRTFDRALIVDCKRRSTSDRAVPAFPWLRRFGPSGRRAIVSGSLPSSAGKSGGRSPSSLGQATSQTRSPDADRAFRRRPGVGLRPCTGERAPGLTSGETPRWLASKPSRALDVPKSQSRREARDCARFG
jgi:hypothetical protein